MSGHVSGGRCTPSRSRRTGDKRKYCSVNLPFDCAPPTGTFGRAVGWMIPLGAVICPGNGIRPKVRSEACAGGGKGRGGEKFRRSAQRPQVEFVEK